MKSTAVLWAALQCRFSVDDAGILLRINNLTVFIQAGFDIEIRRQARELFAPVCSKQTARLQRAVWNQSEETAVATHCGGRLGVQESKPCESQTFPVILVPSETSWML